MVPTQVTKVAKILLKKIPTMDRLEAIHVAYLILEELEKPDNKVAEDKSGE